MVIDPIGRLSLDVIGLFVLESRDAIGCEDSSRVRDIIKARVCTHDTPIKEEGNGRRHVNEGPGNMHDRTMLRKEEG